MRRFVGATEPNCNLAWPSSHGIIARDAAPSLGKNDFAPSESTASM
ncbi:MAG: hypothetical protein OSA48_12055 [Akkermansiaceae bacterium]|nr:hypothetical protein [Akkermansiaceae bacterium]